MYFIRNDASTIDMSTKITFGGTTLTKLFFALLLLGIGSTASAEWQSYLSVDKNSSLKEGFAFSNWTILSPTLNWPDDKIEAALVASCNDRGEKSLYVRILPKYPATNTQQPLDIVNGQIKWDSSYSYGAPFTYDRNLNALQLRSGLEDSFSMIKEGNTVTIRIPWQEDHHAVFEFSLNGSSQALEKAFSYCSVNLRTS